MFQTLQDRLVKELALNGIVTVEAANLFLREVYIPAHNAKFAVAAAQAGSAFVAIPGVDLALDFMRSGGAPGRQRQLRVVQPAQPPDCDPGAAARPFRQGAGEGARISRRRLRHFPRAAMPWALRQNRRPDARTKSRLNPLNGRPVEMGTGKSLDHSPTGEQKQK